jgi:hypothetical protein
VVSPVPRSWSGPRGSTDLAELADAGVDHVIDPAAASRWRLIQVVLDRLGIPRPAVPLPGTTDRTWADTSTLVDYRWPDGIGCPHVPAIRAVLPGSAACLDCLRDGQQWVHLRVCLSCGNVGCCDSSPGCRDGSRSRSGGSEASVRIAKADLVSTEANLLDAYPDMAALVTACDAFCSA